MAAAVVPIRAVVVDSQAVVGEAAVRIRAAAEAVEAVEAATERWRQQRWWWPPLSLSQRLFELAKAWCAIPSSERGLLVRRRFLLRPRERDLYLSLARFNFDHSHARHSE